MASATLTATILEMILAGATICQQNSVDSRSYGEPWT